MTEIQRKLLIALLALLAAGVSAIAIMLGAERINDWRLVHDDSYRLDYEHARAFCTSDFIIGSKQDRLNCLEKVAREYGADD